jgi:hypothetical protein
MFLANFAGDRTPCGANGLFSPFAHSATMCPSLPFGAVSAPRLRSVLAISASFFAQAYIDAVVPSESCASVRSSVPWVARSKRAEPSKPLGSRPCSSADPGADARAGASICSQWRTPRIYPFMASRSSSSRTWSWDPLPGSFSATSVPTSLGSNQSEVTRREPCEVRVQGTSPCTTATSAAFAWTSSPRLARRSCTSWSTGPMSSSRISGPAPCRGLASGTRPSRRAIRA